MLLVSDVRMGDGRVGACIWRVGKGFTHIGPKYRTEKPEASPDTLGSNFFPLSFRALGNLEVQYSGVLVATDMTSGETENDAESPFPRGAEKGEREISIHSVASCSEKKN